MDILIRSAIESDMPRLKSFEQGIIEAERPYDNTIKPDFVSYYDIGEMMASKDAEVAVAEINGDLAASGYVRKKKSLNYVVSDYHAFIGFLYVAPEYRGRGVNRQVLNHLFEWARYNDLPEVHLAVYLENKPAVRAYEKMGFQPHMLEMRVNLDEK